MIFFFLIACRAVVAIFSLSVFLGGGRGVTYEQSHVLVCVYIPIFSYGYISRMADYTENLYSVCPVINCAKHCTVIYSDREQPLAPLPPPKNT